MTTLKFIRISAMEHTAQSMLAMAKHNKPYALSRVRSLREKIRTAPLGHAFNYRVEMLEAASRLQEINRMEREAKAALEAHANSLGLTTKRS